MQSAGKGSGTALISIVAPNLPATERSLRIVADELRSGAAIEDAILERTDLRNCRQSRIILRGVRFLRVQAGNSQLDDLRLLDVSHESCDWANATWNHAKVGRVIFEGCRMSGFAAADSKFQNTRFSRCKLDLSVFHRTQFTSCLFEECVLHDGSFEEAIFRDVVFRGCDLRKARLARIRSEGLDVRGCMVQGLAAEPQDVRGMIIEPLQALDLIHLLGVNIKKLEE